MRQYVFPSRLSRYIRVWRKAAIRDEALFCRRLGRAAVLPVESRLRWEWHRINVLGEHENVEHVVDETHESPNFKAIPTTIGGRGVCRPC
jgi:hypothetical protein